MPAARVKKNNNNNNNNNNNTRKGKTKESVDENSWKRDIEDVTLNDERWTCVIAMIVETRLEHVSYLNLFNEAAEGETRRAIFSLSYQKLIRATKLLAKSDLHQGICHFASKQMEDQGGAALPMGPSPSPSPSPWLLCRLIKFFINRIKTRQLEFVENRVSIEREITKEIESLKVKRPDTLAKSKGDSRETKSYDKLNTKLSGEELPDGVQIDDGPIDGPNLYVVLSGFHDKNLIDELLNSGLPLTAVFKLLRPGEEEVDVNHPQVCEFWSSFEAALKDPKTTKTYYQLICQRFCPPEMQETELETSKSDAYRRISFLMYDLCNLMRQHDCYIRKMTLQAGLENNKSDTPNTETYDSIMKVIPEECASVSMVLDAVISQIDGSQPLRETVEHREVLEETFEQRFRSKIDCLNAEFDVFDINETEIPVANCDPRVIAHGDSLGINYNHRPSMILQNFGIRVLKEFADSMIWRNVEVLTKERMEMYEYHIDQISNCFDVSMDRSTTSHYLHLLLFDKMVKEKNGKKSFHGSTESFYNFCQREELTDNELLQRSELLGLIDTRETNSPELFAVQNPETLDPEDFDSVQLLSSDVFPQVFSTCFQEFDSFESIYFAPTDSTLILFRNNRASDNILPQEYSASIRTPVCLRDFNEFVIDEETDWIEKVDELHSRKLAALLEAKSPETRENLPSAYTYTDADFILRNSLKAEEVRKQKSRQSLIVGMETAGSSRDELPAGAKRRRSKEAKETNPGKLKILKRKGTMINPGHKREESLETNPTLENTTSIYSQEGDELPTFLGYDIANHRIEMSGSTTDFRFEDGTIVKVNREEWRYGEARETIIIDILNNSLVAQVVDQRPTFHLTTTNGILMVFTPPRPKCEESDTDHSLDSKQSITKRNYQAGKIGRESENSTSERRWIPEMAVDPGFRTSWPSGLVVETLPGDNPSVPFYIKQSYLSKGPECNEISKETQRVFLRDGTIVVFLDDQSVRLMRPNGCIVTCNGFEKSHQTDSTINQNLKILKKIVLQPDGRRYEIHNDEITTELGEELVRTSSDYEVGERFTRRSDGTNILLNSKGVLAVSFPDDSRITTRFVIDKDPVYCEWTDEEHREFNSYDNEDDGFVFISIIFCMEHKNYARVVYDQSKIGCTLSMPGEVDVHISSDSAISVSVETATLLEVKMNEISFGGRMGRGFTRSVFNLENLRSSSTSKNSFLEMTDYSGNIFRVDWEGNILYKKFRARSDPLEDGDKENYSSSSGLFTSENNKCLPNSRGYRLFVVKRDLSSYEHLHHSARVTQEADQTASIFFHRVNERSDQKICTTFTPLNPITASKAYLQSYKVKSVIPTNEGRRDLLPSTYSLPWNYLIPYGKKNGRGIYDRTWYLPLNISPNLFVPEILLVRTIEKIKNREYSALKKCREALRCFAEKTTLDDSCQCCIPVSRISASREERDIEDWLNDFTLGGKKTFDRTLYFDGLSSSRYTKGQESTISKRTISGSRDKVDKEEIEWYKFCLRDHIVPDYFADIQGACFTWVLECFDKILTE